MAYLLRILVGALALGLLLPGQQIGQQIGQRIGQPALQVEAEQALHPFFQRSRAALQYDAANDSTGLAGAMLTLGLLRLGDFAAARATLNQSCPQGCTPSATPAEAAWSTIATYWYLRATHDVLTAQGRLADLRRTIEAATEKPVATGTFVEEALLVHGLFCLGGLTDTVARLASPAAWHAVAAADRPGAAWTRRAIERQHELERAAWQPGRGHFRSQLDAGRILVPEPAELSLLVPAFAGLLVATGDRTLRHLRNALDQELAATSCLLPTSQPFLAHRAALRLCAAAQLADDEACQKLWLEVLEVGAHGQGLSAAVAGSHLDAACFALTGLRLATGAYVDESWIRLRPWLPQRLDHLVLRGMYADGARLDLELTVRRGALGPDERDEPALQANPAARRLRLRLTLASTEDGASRQLVVQGRAVQYIATMRPGEVLARSLPCEPLSDRAPEPQDEPGHGLGLVGGRR